MDKPAGLVTHPAYRHPAGTLCDLVFARQAARGEARPWLLHRLDRETSGLLLFAKTEVARRALVRQFERRTIHKQYVAIVTGTLNPRADTLDAPLRRDPLDRRRTIVDAAGQPSRTRYRVLAVADGLTLVLAEPLTGRTHQIRAHFAWRGAPLAGDTRYQPAEAPLLAPRPMLYAWRLCFRAPLSGEPRCLRAPPPPDLLALLRRLSGDDLDALIPLRHSEALCN
ncbi:MAG: RNA pseudouridine synthase [Ktedonobacterales bacterium]|nr:RNA pseudouridine synthase [Ktedonobacterales bacterium]